MSDGTQVWTLDHQGRAHRVEASGSSTHQVRWLVDGAEAGEKKSWDEKVALDGAELGTVVVRFSTLGRPRRATWFGPDEDAQALAGVGGVDLVPAEGSAAAAYEAKVREHPGRYAVLATAGGVATVVVPLVLGLLVVRFAVSIDWPDLPLPDLPDLPDLPEIPWPDLPSVPWPDLPGPPDLRVPDWVRWLLDKVKYVWPVVLAYVLARAEINRRRKQDELRRARAAEHRRDESGPVDGQKDGQADGQ
ncbi:hypothetical protein [Nocardioides sp.]|uniref:hypothetical protein n=1 Tax=Nocardioides sp. TaxID=35761 RepID=UPI001A182CC9|nr:hypothetical protein [Nocardioides sp.]MBJ7358759.1 hypothetical protein [Nocardioides sp.]